MTDNARLPDDLRAKFAKRPRGLLTREARDTAVVRTPPRDADEDVTSAPHSKARGAVTDLPSERPWLMADEGFPVDGDKLAAHLYDPGHGRVRRHAFGDLLWPMAAGSMSHDQRGSAP